MKRNPLILTLLAVCSQLCVCIGEATQGNGAVITADHTIHPECVPESADTAGFPRALFFRTPWRFVDRSLAEFDAEHARLDGIISKCFKEELPDNDDVQERLQMNRFAQNYPDQYVICHLNGLGRDPDFEREPFFSGHWLYQGWKPLEVDIDAETTTLQLGNTNVFRMNRGRDGGEPDNLIIVPVVNGETLWDEAEHVRLTAIVDRTTIEVERGQWGTTARAFSASTAQVARHEVNGPWGTGPLLWKYNFADDCPTNADGQNCADVFSDQIASWFAPTGVLANFTGIQFDLARQEPGIDSFYQKLRAKVGNELLLIADGGVDDSQRITQHMNGMEAEGWCGPKVSDYSTWCNALNYFEYWERFCEQTPTVNYVVHKADGDYSLLADRQRARLDFAAATAVGIAYAAVLKPNDPLVGRRAPEFPRGHLQTWDETLGGDLQQRHWLGVPVAPLRHVAKTTPDRLSNHGVRISDEFIDRWSSTSENTTFSREAGSPNVLKITQAGDATYRDFAHAGGDLTLFVDARVSGSDRIPKVLSATIGSVTVRGYVGTQGDAPICFYFRDMPAGEIDITLDCDDSIDLFIKNLTMHNSPAAVVREFEHGVVLANPSTQETSFALDVLYPGWSFARLSGTHHHSVADGNNGERVGASLRSPGENGVFLRKLSYQ